MAVELEIKHEFFSQTCNDLPLGFIIFELPVEDQIFAPQLHAASCVLEELDLFGARITDEGAKHLRHMPRLKTLELCGGGITDAGVKHIGDACRELTLLNLGQNFRISDAAVPFLLQLDKLGSLNLQYSRISSEGVTQLSRLSNLTTLALKGCNRVSQAAVEELRAKCPRLSEVGLDNATASA